MSDLVLVPMALWAFVVAFAAMGLLWNRLSRPLLFGFTASLSLIGVQSLVTQFVYRLVLTPPDAPLKVNAIDSVKDATLASLLASVILGIAFLWLLQRAFAIRDT